MSPVYYNGRIILSGCLVINDKKEVLLLYRKDHHHYETPGGKVDPEECTNPDNPTIEDLAKTAERELHEELGEDLKIQKPKYFGKAEFTIPDGRRAVANKFLTKIISGTPKITEPELFSEFDYLPIGRLEEYPLSPDLKILLPKIKELI